MRLFAILILTALLGACSGPGKTLFVVLPDEKGKVGEVVVEGKNNEKKVLNTSYAGSYVNDEGKLTATKLEKKKVDALFGKALAARPVLPSSFILYFKPDSQDLVETSMPEFENLFVDIKKRGSYRIEVIGHTDSLGKDEYNAKLSLKRAQTIAADLVKRGIPEARITATGRGERDMLVVTKDNVAESKNRRVEIDVR